MSWKVNIVIHERGKPDEKLTRSFSTEEEAYDYFSEILDMWTTTFENDNFNYDFAIRPQRKPYK